MIAVSWCKERTSTPSPCISSLARCATNGGPPAPSERGERLVHLLVAHQLAVEVIHVTVVACHREAHERARDRRGFPTQVERVASAGFHHCVQHCERRLRVAGDRDLHLERLRILDCRGLADGVEHPLPDRAERELVEQHAHLLPVPRTLTELVGLHPEIEIAAQQRHLAVLEDAVAHLVEVLPLLRWQLVEVLQDRFERAVGGHELRGGLLADAGHTGQVVARVAAQRRVFGVLHRCDAGALEDAGFVVEHVVGHAPPVVQHFDVRVFDELVGVAVAGHDDHVDAGVTGPPGQRADHVIGLDALDFEDGNAQRVEHLADERHLGAKDVGCRLSARLVLGVHRVAKGRSGSVERNRDVLGLLVGEHFHEHRREAVHRVGDRAVGRGEVGGQRVERAEGERVPVEQQQLRHHADAMPSAPARFRAHAFGAPGGYGVIVPSTTCSATRRTFTRRFIASVCRKRHASCSLNLWSSMRTALCPVDDLAGLEPFLEVTDARAPASSARRAGRARPRSQESGRSSGTA